MCCLTYNRTASGTKRSAEWDPAPDAVVTVTPGGLLCLRPAGTLCQDIIGQYGSKTTVIAATSAESSRPGMKPYHDAMNDRNIHYLDKARLDERLANSLMARRMMEHTIFKNLCPTEVDFSPSIVWTSLVQQGEEWLHATHHHDVTVDQSRHFVTLQRLQCVSSPDVFTQLFTEGMRHIPGDEFTFSVSLQHFSPWSLDSSTLSKTVAKSALAEALLRFEESL